MQVVNQDDRNNQLLTHAMHHDFEALGKLLEAQRDHLRRRASIALGEKVGVRVDASDIVQQTCMSAINHFREFRGRSLEDFLAWLFGIHDRNIIDEVRKHTRAARRTVEREQPIDGAPIGTLAKDRENSPSENFGAKERASVLEAALNQLPDVQREVVKLKHLKGWPLARIAEHLGRSEPAVVGLLTRGMRKLKQLLNDDFGINI